MCNGDIDRPLRIEVMDWEKNGKHVFMGQVRAMFFVVCVFGCL